MILRHLARASRRAVFTSASIVYLVTLIFLYLFISSIYADDPLSPLYRRAFPSYPLSDRLRDETESWVVKRNSSTRGGAWGEQQIPRIHGNSVAVDDDDTTTTTHTDPGREEEEEAMRLCVAVPTKARRDGADYLDLALAGLTRGLTDDQRGRVKIMLFFPDGEERERAVREKGLLRGGRGGADDGSYLGDMKHPTALDPWLIRQSEERGHIRHIPYALHFMAALDRCLHYGNNRTHILIMEDDVIARPDWYDRLSTQVLPELKRKAQVPWTFVMLFWTEHYMFWSDEDIPVIFGRFVWPALGVLVVTLVAGWFLRPNGGGYTRIGSQADKPEDGDVDVSPAGYGVRPITALLLGISFYILICPFIGLDLYRGKFANYPVPRGLSARRTNQCCFQSILFTHRSARETIEAFKPVVEGKTGYDWEQHGQDYLLFSMEEQGRRTSRVKGWLPEWLIGGDGNVKGWAWNPSLFQHFGDVSTYTSDVTGPRFRSWNFELGLREVDEDGGVQSKGH
jgi:hypothetical protein